MTQETSTSSEQPESASPTAGASTVMNDGGGEAAVAPSPESLAQEPDPRRLMLVVGSGRSGTSLFTGVMQRLGFYVPEPEVVADETNPTGFGEPQWVVDLHTE